MLAVHEGLRRRAEKRAGIMLPLAVGAMIPGIVNKAIERAHSTEHRMDAASGHPFKSAAFPSWLTSAFGKAKANPMEAGGSVAKGLGLDQVVGAPGKGIGSGLSKMVERKMFGQEFGEKRSPFAMGSQAAVSAFGKEMGTTGANLLRDMANKAMEAVGHAGDSSAREAILGDLKRSDAVLANADDKTLMEAYHTMTRFAPVLSTDKNAVRSFLRQAVMSGAGPDFMSIKLLADSERAVTGEKDRR
jgi:Arc/MetJ family transcription regulator